MMRKAAWMVLLVALFCAAILPGIASQQAARPPSIVGVWRGTVTAGKQSLVFAIQITNQGDSYSGSFQIPDRSADFLPLGSLTFKDGNLHFMFGSLGIRWDGKLDTAGTHLIGIASDGDATYPLVFSIDPSAHTSGRPQEPKGPLPYDSEEVEFINPVGGLTLGGTLTHPKSPGPFPAVVLLSGSGQLDRNGANYGHKPFLVLADTLTRHGIAVLRVDDRGVGKSTGDAVNATMSDFPSDVLASAAYLRSRKDIGKIGVIGYGTGGAIAAISAVGSTDIGFIAMMGAPALDGRRILSTQADALAQSTGAAPEEIFMIRRFQATAFGILIAMKDPEQASVALVSAMTDEIAKLPQGRRVGWLKMMSAMTRSYNTPWMRYFAGFDPAPYLRRLSCPTLVMYCELDTEVLATPNQQTMEFDLKGSLVKDYKVQIETGLNHLFQTSKSGSPTEYEQIEETISPVPMKTLGDWIIDHSK